MKRQVRLRTEIIVNLLLLMGAALFFVSLLLLKFAEEELLAQRVKAVTTALRTVAAALGADTAAGSDALAARSRRLLETFAAQEPRLAWTLVDSQLRPLAAGGATDAPPLVQDDLVRAGVLAEPVLRLRYQTVLQPFGDTSSNFLRYSVPLPGRDGMQGVLQVRLGLDDLAERLVVARRLTLSYVVLYGLVLVLFGGYLLGRTVAQPVRRLVDEVRGVARGDLSRVALVEGPAEIAELASSFNAMTASLLASRQQTEATIESLHAANLELRKTQDALVRSEKLATVGHLAAGMAHELGNPLAAVLGYLELLQSDLPAGSQRDLAGYALKEIGRIDGLVRELLDY
ncbi:MAG TPA: histidine kinase dimerization/phospho-acceptor domain-containing protein, partial [Thioalkalivibrio sp.]|nr:histidine kinase dimerization/phospho-acceptor domain-containing protein [Thioalkalivibrio sp.]